MGKRLDIKPGDRFSWLEIIKEVEKRKGKRYFMCRCICQNIGVHRLVSLRSGAIKSCGCLRNEQNRNAGFKHGFWGTSLYWSWHSMKERCLNANAKAYQYYGGREITVCKEWMDFEGFCDWSLKNGYEEGLTIERKDVNGNYEPSNCCWIPLSEQANNTRRSKIIELNGISQNVRQWEKELGFGRNVVSKRLLNGWSIDKALTTPIQTNYQRFNQCK